jgi:hypothetical protein
MNEWLILNYRDERGNNPIRDWLHDKREVPVKARAKIQRILLQLAGTKLWVRPLASNLDHYDGIVEIRVLYMNTQYRLLGCRGPENREFTILFPAREQGDEFLPPNAPTIAQNRMRIVMGEKGIVLKNRRRTCEHIFG